VGRTRSAIYWRHLPSRTLSDFVLLSDFIFVDFQNTQGNSFRRNRTIGSGISEAREELQRIANEDELRDAPPYGLGQ